MQPIDDFTRQYLETALWSSTDESREDGGDPIDDNYGIDDIAASTMENAKRDCDRFRDLAGVMLEENAPNDNMGAHDFWLTRNGHGAGFWDGDWPINGDALTAICKEFGEVTLYIGDDGQVWGHE